MKLGSWLLCGDCLNVAVDTNWRYKDRIIRYKVLTAVIMKSIIIRDVTQCSLVEVYGRFGGTNYHHLHAKIVSQAIHKQEGSNIQSELCEQIM
jgi:hypothetical protein